MNVITKRTILYYMDQYPLDSTSLKNWHDEIAKSAYRNFNALKKVYGNASVIANNRVVFNIKGNSFRLIVSFNFEAQALYVIWFGTQAAYDKIDAADIKHLKNPYK